jgi:Zn-dependent M28 family amino/carboxypeptidase
VEAPVTVSLRARSDLEETLSLKNVAGILRGKDPELAGTAVVVSAHYDHVGMGLGSDRVYNGANDNASGTAAVIELAAALARLPERPRRSIVFLAFDGEERGLFGSRRYLEAPVFPLDKTVAVINLEHLGRTDSAEGTKLKTVSVTGFHYSSVGPILKEAGEGTGVVVQPQDDDGESYFTRSDNITFARKGVPAHTVAVSLTYPDYHQPGDHWDKLDYDNMAAVTRAIALAILRIADAVDVPAWNKDSPAADNYRKVRENQAPESGAPPG